MKDSEIIDMAQNINAISDKDCALLLWATMPKLDVALEVIKAWGFRYATTAFTWIKTTKSGKPATSPGYYTASNTEIVLLGIKGRMPPAERLVNSVILEPRREHSRKPDEVRERIVRVFGDLPRVELFARYPADGWASYGNAVDGQDIREALKVRPAC